MIRLVGIVQRWAFVWWRSLHTPRQEVEQNHLFGSENGKSGADKLAVPGPERTASRDISFGLKQSFG